ncbi:MAG: glutaredoxin 3 [Rhodospirillales bacterium]
MPEIDIYTTPFCPFCVRAKHLLDHKGAAFTEINLMVNPERRQEMIERANGGYTVPQIFIDGQHIGGCDELYALEQAGELDPLLQKVETE